MKTLFAIAIFGMTTSSNAETLAFPSFRIEVEDGWAHSIERGPQASPEWGDHSGYQYDYLERGSFYRQWWLANERTIIFFVYKSNTESQDIEIDEINKIVDSITVNKH